MPSAPRVRRRAHRGRAVPGSIVAEIVIEMAAATTTTRERSSALCLLVIATRPFSIVERSMVFPKSSFPRVWLASRTDSC